MLDPKILMGTAGFAALATFWGQIKGFFNRFRSLFIVNVQVTGYSLTCAMSAYLWKHFTCSRFGVKSYSGDRKYVRPHSAYEMVAFENMKGSLTFYDGWKPLYVNKEDESLSFSYFRGLFSIEDLILKATAEYNKLEKNKENDKSDRYDVRQFYGTYGNKEDESVPESMTKGTSDRSSGDRPLGWEWDDLGSHIEKNPFSSLYYPDEIQNLIELIGIWKDSEEWCKEHGVDWRLGIGLEGVPGSGKSSFIRAIAQHFDLPIDKYDLVSMSNEELNNNWRRSLNRAPCIVLFEDMDRVFDKDKLIHDSSLSTKGKLTMDGLLNCIQGVDASAGILTFITVNDITKLDDALGVPNEKGESSRPGRLDEIFIFKAMDESCRVQMANRILSDCPDMIPNIVAAGDGETGAQFGKRCADLARKEFWKLKNKLLKKAAPAVEVVH